MSVLVTLEQAKRNLNVTDSYDDAEIQSSLEAAEAIVFAHIEKTYADLVELYGVGSPLTFTRDLEPLRIATKLALNILYDDRTANPITSAFEAVLIQWRAPVIA